MAGPEAVTAGHGRRRPVHGGLGVLAMMRRRIRASEFWLAVIAVGIGAVAGLATVLVATSAHGLQQIFYGIGPGERLSTISALPPAVLVVPVFGGLGLGLLTWLWNRRRAQPIVDPVEANALHGGRMSLQESLFLAVQSILSNGCGASVGLEAAYAQMGAAIASRTGGRLNLRRSDLRTFVGAGAGAGIAAAFGAPLTGAFYAFEVIIGSYAVGNIAPVVGAALAGALIVHFLGGGGLEIHVSATDSLTLTHYLLFAILGVICALSGIAIMRLVAVVERIASRAPGPSWVRPALGGVLLAALAWAQPQTLSSGHGALALDLTAHLALASLAFLILAKAAASIIALGFVITQALLGADIRP